MIDTEAGIGHEALLQSWYDAYRAKSKWLNYTYLVLGEKKTRKRLSMNVAKLAANELSNLAFSEPPAINADDKITEVLQDNNFIKHSKNLAEYIAALGGGVYKLRSDGDKLIIDYVKAYNFRPISWDNNGVYEADFISSKTIDKEKMLVIEKHRRLMQTLPEQNPDGTMKLENGVPVLSNKQEQVGICIETILEDKYGKQKSLPDDMVARQEFVGIIRPMFAYIKTSLANNFNPEEPYGIPYHANAMDTLQALDIAFDSLNSEIVLGKKRIIVPSSSVRKVLNPDTGKYERYFDSSDEVFVALSVDGEDSEKLDIKDNSVTLRIEEIKAAIQCLLDIFCMQVGFSQGYLSFDGGSVKTATEVISNNSKTFKTKTAFENELANGMVAIMGSIRDFLNFAGEAVPTDTKYSVTFDDNVIEDRNAKLDYWATMLAGGLCTKKKALMKVHGISEEEAEAMLKEIEVETPAPINMGF